MTRVTSLDGVHNFRHWHGYTGHDDALVRVGLYRSGHFNRASKADQAYFDGLGIRVVADLRRPRERANEPSPWQDGDKLLLLTSDQDDHAEPPHVRFLKAGDFSAGAVRNYMLSAYRRIPGEAGNRKVFRDAFLALAHGDADEGFLVHCAAGKDRTGIFCALVLGELGVSEDDIVADYLLTNTAVDYDALIPRVRERIEAALGRTIEEAHMKAFLGVDADYIAEAIRSMGGRDAYLRDGLQLSDEDRAALRMRWLA